MLKVRNHFLQSYLTLGVAVGGVHEFQDRVTSSGYVKPWRNVEAKVCYWTSKIKFLKTLKERLRKLC